MQKQELPELTKDELKRFGLKMLQPRDGYRFTLDPLLLCDFASHGNESLIADLGSGTGVMALVMARIAKGALIYAIEQDNFAAGLAEKNLHLNDLSEQVKVINDDILNVRRRLPVSSCDLVLSNPPYRKRGRGRLNLDPGKMAARHETTAGISDFISAAKYLVKPGGRICMVYHPARLPEFMAAAAEQKLAVLRLRMVHGVADAAAKVFLVELGKGRKIGDTEVMPPLVVRSDGENYTDEVRKILLGK